MTKTKKYKQKKRTALQKTKRYGRNNERTTCHKTGSLSNKNTSNREKETEKENDDKDTRLSGMSQRFWSLLGY